MNIRFTQTALDEIEKFFLISRNTTSKRLRE